MADSANILSILQMLASPPPGADAPDVQFPGVGNNVLQQMPAAPQAPQAPPQPSPAAIASAASAASPPAPKPRRSLLDTIGRISDVFATVGGAHPLYQPTLDAREDRATAKSDHALTVDSATIKNATDRFDLGDKHNARLGQAARGLKAIQTAGGDINQAWPILAQRMQLDPETIASVGQALSSDPHALDGLIGASTDPKYDQSKYGGTVVYAKNASGHLVAYQPSLSNDEARSILPDGVEPVDPAKFVDTGGAVVGVGTRSGNVQKILPKTVRPDTVLTTTTQRDIAAGNNKTQLTIAGMPDRKSITPNGGKGTPDGTVPMLLDNIQQGFNDLHGMNALPGEGSGASQLEGAFGRSALGQKIGEQVGTPAAQKRLEIQKNISQLQQAMLKSLPASATRTRFEQEMLARGLPDPSKMNYATAQTVIRQLRDSYANAITAAQKETAKPSAQTPVRPKAQAGWTVVKVQ